MTNGVRKVLGGRVSLSSAVREAFRRGRVNVNRRRERAMLEELNSQGALLRPDLQSLPYSDLLKHFQERVTPSFFPGFEVSDSFMARHWDNFPDETQRLREAPGQILDKRWPLLGFGEMEFAFRVDWHSDPLSGRRWPLDYHADILLWHNDGSDIRVLWELNRLGHLVTLGRAYALTRERFFASEFQWEVGNWWAENPVGRGANWSCAMEVALRAMNLLGAFSLFRKSPDLLDRHLYILLAVFQQHGAHIRRNLEFSHIATSNHYLSDITGLLWLGIMLPELSAAGGWREWALAEMLREMDKQVLPDGADYEGSTAYHCFVVELFLYSFILCRANDIPIEDRYWRKLHAMLAYLGSILRPDGLIPLVGDTDGGQVLPMVHRDANDRAYLLAIGAALFKDSQFKLSGVAAPPELLWVLGEEGLQYYDQLAPRTAEPSSQAFADAGTYVLRDDDLFLLLNANGAENGRPASHRHNDLLSVEVSACGRGFIVDPGTYVYTAKLSERHLFRSTAYHSTIQIDDVEQNTIEEDTPFAIGDEGRVKVLSWENTPERDRVVAEHSGYERLAQPAIHRRTITFNKSHRWWLIDDEILGKGEHSIAARFHFDAGLDVSPFDNNSVIARDPMSGACLIVRLLNLDQTPELEEQFTSRHYGSKVESTTACWTTRSSLPCKLRWAIVPVCAGENPEARMTLDFGRWTLD